MSETSTQYAIPGISQEYDLDAGLKITITPFAGTEIVEVLVTYPLGDDDDTYAVSTMMDGSSRTQLLYNAHTANGFQMTDVWLSVSYADDTGTLTSETFYYKFTNGENAGVYAIPNNTVLATWQVNP
jgi:hypothetical protein